MVDEKEKPKETPDTRRHEPMREKKDEKEKPKKKKQYILSFLYFYFHLTKSDYY